MKSLPYQAARLALGSLEAEEMKATVDSLMNEGFYAEECLAAMDASAHPPLDEVLPAFRAALEYHSVPVPSRDQAIRQLIEMHLSEIAAGVVDPVDGIKRLLDEVGWEDEFREGSEQYLGDAYGVERLVGHFYAADTLKEPRTSAGSTPAYAPAEDVGGAKKAEAEKWLTANATRNA
jgi:hypothetical protein